MELVLKEETAFWAGTTAHIKNVYVMSVRKTGSYKNVFELDSGFSLHVFLGLKDFVELLEQNPAMKMRVRRDLNVRARSATSSIRLAHVAETPVELGLPEGHDGGEKFGLCGILTVLVADDRGSDNFRAARLVGDEAMLRGGVTEHRAGLKRTTIFGDFEDATRYGGKETRALTRCPETDRKLVAFCDEDGRCRNRLRQRNLGEEARINKVGSGSCTTTYPKFPHFRPTCARCMGPHPTRECPFKEIVACQYGVVTPGSEAWLQEDVEDGKELFFVGAIKMCTRAVGGAQDPSCGANNAKLRIVFDLDDVTQELLRETNTGAGFKRLHLQRLRNVMQVWGWEEGQGPETAVQARALAQVPIVGKKIVDADEYSRFERLTRTPAGYVKLRLITMQTGEFPSILVAHRARLFDVPGTWKLSEPGDAETRCGNGQEDVEEALAADWMGQMVLDVKAQFKAMPTACIILRVAGIREQVAAGEALAQKVGRGLKPTHEGWCRQLAALGLRPTPSGVAVQLGLGTRSESQLHADRNNKLCPLKPGHSLRGRALELFPVAHRTSSRLKWSSALEIVKHLVKRYPKESIRDINRAVDSALLGTMRSFSYLSPFSRSRYERGSWCGVELGLVGQVDDSTFAAPRFAATGASGQVLGVYLRVLTKVVNVKLYGAKKKEEDPAGVGHPCAADVREFLIELLRFNGLMPLSVFDPARTHIPVSVAKTILGSGRRMRVVSKDSAVALASVERTHQDLKMLVDRILRMPLFKKLMATETPRTALEVACALAAAARNEKLVERTGVPRSGTDTNFAVTPMGGGVETRLWVEQGDWMCHHNMLGELARAAACAQVLSKRDNRRLHDIDRELAKAIMQAPLRVGDHVEWRGKKGQLEGKNSGVVTKDSFYRDKTVHVRPDTGTQRALEVNRRTVSPIIGSPEQTAFVPACTIEVSLEDTENWDEFLNKVKAIREGEDKLREFPVRVRGEDYGVRYCVGCGGKRIVKQEVAREAKFVLCRQVGGWCGDVDDGELVSMGQWVHPRGRTGGLLDECLPYTTETNDERDADEPDIGLTEEDSGDVESEPEPLEDDHGTSEAGGSDSDSSGWTLGEGGEETDSGDEGDDRSGESGANGSSEGSSSDLAAHASEGLGLNDDALVAKVMKACCSAVEQATKADREQAKVNYTEDAAIYDLTLQEWEEITCVAQSIRILATQAAQGEAEVKPEIARLSSGRTKYVDQFTEEELATAREDWRWTPSFDVWVGDTAFAEEILQDWRGVLVPAHVDDEFLRLRVRIATERQWYLEDAQLSWRGKQLSGEVSKNRVCLVVHVGRDKGGAAVFTEKKDDLTECALRLEFYPWEIPPEEEFSHPRFGRWVEPTISAAMRKQLRSKKKAIDILPSYLACGGTTSSMIIGGVKKELVGTLGTTNSRGRTCVVPVEGEGPWDMLSRFILDVKEVSFLVVRCAARWAPDGRMQRGTIGTPDEHELASPTPTPLDHRLVVTAGNFLQEPILETTDVPRAFNESTEYKEEYAKTMGVRRESGRFQDLLCEAFRQAANELAMSFSPLSGFKVLVSQYGFLEASAIFVLSGKARLSKHGHRSARRCEVVYRIWVGGVLKLILSEHIDDFLRNVEASYKAEADCLWRRCFNCEWHSCKGEGQVFCGQLYRQWTCVLRGEVVSISMQHKVTALEPWRSNGELRGEGVRNEDGERLLEPDEVTRLRGVRGSVGFIVENARPDWLFDARSQARGADTERSVGEARGINRVVKGMRDSADVELVLQVGLYGEQLVFIMTSDCSFQGKEVELKRGTETRMVPVKSYVLLYTSKKELQCALDEQRDMYVSMLDWNLNSPGYTLNEELSRTLQAGLLVNDADGEVPVGSSYAGEALGMAEGEERAEDVKGRLREFVNEPEPGEADVAARDPQRLRYPLDEIQVDLTDSLSLTQRLLRRGTQMDGDPRLTRAILVCQSYSDMREIYHCSDLLMLADALNKKPSAVKRELFQSCMQGMFRWKAAGDRKLGENGLGTRRQNRDLRELMCNTDSERVAEGGGSQPTAKQEGGE